MRTRLRILSSFLLLLSAQLIVAQVKGVVTDESGAPLAGVEVSAETSGESTFSEMDGSFELPNTKPGDRLTFSFEGFATKVEIAKANMRLKLTAAKVEDMDLVVVEGYVTRTKAKSANAVATVTAETINNRPNASAIQTLQGQVAGLNITSGSGQPGNNALVLLRGVNSINGNVEPLFVVDGVPLNIDNFRSINPHEIESVSVLKDAGAIAQYGNRGANGVIVVTTKRGKYNTQTRYGVSSQFGYSFIQDHRYNVMSSSEILRLENITGQGFGATLTPAQIDQYPFSTDWRDVIMRVGTAQNHNFDITSGSSNLSTFTSFNFFQQDGTVKGSDLQRFSLRNNLDGRSDNGKLIYSTTVSLNYSINNLLTNLGTGAVNRNPLVASLIGVPYLRESDYQNGAQLLSLFQNPGPFQGSLAPTPLMILDLIKTHINRVHEFKTISNARFGYKLTDNLSVNTLLGLDYTQTRSLRNESPKSFNALLFLNPGQQFGGFQTEQYAHDYQFVFNGDLTYAKTFADKHTIQAKALYEVIRAEFKSFSMTQRGLDPLAFYPGAGTGFIPFDPSNPNFYLPAVGSGLAFANLISYFGVVDYDFASKYGISGSVRQDGTYRFAPGYRWGTFWSVSGRWNIDKENFMQNSNFNMLKLRASYGSTGNQLLGGQSIYAAPNNWLDRYALIRTYAANLGFIPIPGNLELQWETNFASNVGIDFEWKRRLRGSIDLYSRKSTDLLDVIPTSAIFGQYEIDGNIGSLRNRGIEMNIQYDLIKKPEQGFNVRLFANGSFNENTILDISSETGEIPNAQTNLNIKEGLQFGQFWVLRYAGINPVNGNLLFYDANGNLTENPNDDDRYNTNKSFIPRYQGGFGFEIDYKGFFLTTQFNFVADVWRLDIDQESLINPNNIGQFNLSRDMLNYWSPSNPNTNMPSLNVTNWTFAEYSDMFLFDASYIRLRNIQLGYNFSERILGNSGIKAARVYVQGENLITFTRWRGYDAESPRNLDAYQFPNPRILTFGADLRF